MFVLVVFLLGATNAGTPFRNLIQFKNMINHKGFSSLDYLGYGCWYVEYAFFFKLYLLNNNFIGVVGEPTVQKYLIAQTDVVKNMINATTAYRVVFSVVHRRSSPMIGKDYPEVESNVQIELIHVIGKRATVIERLSNVTFRIDPRTMSPISMAHIKATRRQHANNIDCYFKRLIKI